MLLADPGAALRETRRVLRPGGRVALAAWTDAGDNPWASVAQEELAKLAALPPPAPDEPHMFSFSDPARIRELLDESGFDDVVIDQLDLSWRYEDLDAWWDVLLDVSTGLATGVGKLTPGQRDDLRDAIDARLAQYVAPDGSAALPGRTHVAAASA